MVREGENFVSLIGKITWPDFKRVGANSSKLFKAKLAIPVANSDKFQYLKIAGWNSIAEALNDVEKDKFIKVHGHIEERSYDGKCKHCGGFDKKYWTEVIVDNFMVLED
jgi:hypothetical protein